MADVTTVVDGVVQSSKSAISVYIDGVWRGVAGSGGGVTADGVNAYAINIYDTTETLYCAYIIRAGEKITLPTMSGINGYNTDKTANAVLWTNGQQITPAGNIDIYTITLATVGLYLNGTRYQATNVNTKYGTDVTLPKTLGGYTTYGYSTSATTGSSGAGSYFTSKKYYAAANLYARVWKPISASFSGYTGNGGYHYDIAASGTVVIRPSVNCSLNGSSQTYPQVGYVQFDSDGKIVGTYQYITANITTAGYSLPVTVENSGGFVRLVINSSTDVTLSVTTPGSFTSSTTLATVTIYNLNGSVYTTLTRSLNQSYITLPTVSGYNKYSTEYTAYGGQGTTFGTVSSGIQYNFGQNISPTSNMSLYLVKNCIVTIYHGTSVLSTTNVDFSGKFTLPSGYVVYRRTRDTTSHSGFDEAAGRTISIYGSCTFYTAYISNSVASYNTTGTLRLYFPSGYSRTLNITMGAYRTLNNTYNSPYIAVSTYLSGGTVTTTHISGSGTSFNININPPSGGWVYVYVDSNGATISTTNGMSFACY